MKLAIYSPVSGGLLLVGLVGQAAPSRAQRVSGGRRRRGPATAMLAAGNWAAGGGQVGANFVPLNRYKLDIRWYYIVIECKRIKDTTTAAATTSTSTSSTSSTTSTSSSSSSSSSSSTTTTTNDNNYNKNSNDTSNNHNDSNNNSDHSHTNNNYYETNDTNNSEFSKGVQILSPMRLNVLTT